MKPARGTASQKPSRGLRRRGPLPTLWIYSPCPLTPGPQAGLRRWAGSTHCSGAAQRAVWIRIRPFVTWSSCSRLLVTCWWGRILGLDSFLGAVLILDSSWGWGTFLYSRLRKLQKDSVNFSQMKLCMAQFRAFLSNKAD